ncbi:hypothetical protein AADZ90_021390 [Aestuariibius sp. 2305UL40-4]|uniref:hypothetical protein n=1 Tax=Aestuariibius violaceus TaxID=3234132 RepID=UPI00345EFBD1
MTRDNVDRLIVQMEATLRKFEKQMEQGRKVGTKTAVDIERRMGKMDRNIQGITARVAKNLKGAFAVGAITAGLTTLTRNVQTAIRSMAQLGAEAERAGLGVEEFQEWAFVAQQNRIGIDALVDSMKELNLRADEFIVTGKGPAAEAFQRIGFSAAELSRALEDPSELMLEVIARMQHLENAAQIRVADELFGGTGGEQFVQLLDEGANGIRRLKQEAREAGAVLDAELIEKAEELDRKYAELTTRMSTFFKRMVVNAADALEYSDGIIERQDRMIQQIEQIDRMGGDGISLADDPEKLRTAAGAAEELANSYEQIQASAQALASALSESGFDLGEGGMIDAGMAAIDLSGELTNLTRAFQRGQISADDFEAQLIDLVSRADEVVAGLGSIDGVDLSAVTGQVGSLQGALQALAQQAQGAAEAMLGIPGAGSTEPRVYSGRGGDPRLQGGSFTDWRSRTATPQAPSRSIRPRSAPQDIDFGTPAPASAGSGGGGRSSAAELTDYQKLVKDTREEIKRLEAEAVALLAVAETGQTYGDAVDYARRKAELLYEAQAAGRQLTPELREEIDQLAQAYVDAGDKAEKAAQQLQDMEENARRGADRMADLFLSIRDGSLTAMDALESLLLELTRVQLQKQLLAAADAAGGTGLGQVFSALGGLLGPGRATGGPVRAGVPYPVNENTPRSEVMVPSHSGAILNVSQAKDALRRGAGGETNVTVRTTHVIENRSSQVGVKRKRGPDGNMRTIVFDLMDQYVASGRGDRAMSQRFGNRPQPR